MRLNLLLTLITAAAIFTIGCGGPGTTPTGGTNTNVANANANVPVPATNSALETTKKPEAATANNAPTLAPVVQAYYEALKTKNAALLKSVMSKEFIASVEADMKEEKKTNIAEYLAEFDKIPEKPVEVRNEKIEGTDAVAEIKGGTYVNWTPFAFINEGGKWKFTGGSPVLK